MDYKLSRVSNRPITPDTEGNESGENFRRVVGQFIHGDRGNASQIFQPSVDRSPLDSVATSVATSIASSRDSTSPHSDMKAETEDLSPLEGKKRAAESSTLSRKLATQEMQRKRRISATAISTKMINDTIQYLQAGVGHDAPRHTIATEQTQPEDKCRRCAAADEERLYD
ncbi:hypothetical protein PENARI_c021G05219 [Penicillium arizonense]|uniref:Uncharacterized protein n=1 Tax=Penicillium arizonense TaxID=1835702 RepID=A0A1F5L953_PENAI|nr:hypothetical protein PENARI_c021G05219 [Penicillium arizonense]OGE49441.1 hypothetical protein PENARI_c021G05219 [Penicillium arizonense]